MAADLERIAQLPSRREIGDWVALVADGALRKRAASISEVENTTFAEIAPAAASKAPSSPSLDELEDVDVEVQLTGDASAGHVSPVRGRRRARAWLAVTAALGVALFGVILGRSRWTVALGASALPAPAAAAATSPPVAKTATHLPTPAAPTAPSTTAPPVAAAPVIPQAVAPAVAPTPQAPRSDCKPPYTVDAAGVRIPKRWCS
jgi:hypothetical protein